MSTEDEHDPATCAVCTAYLEHFAERGTAYERRLLAALAERQAMTGTVTENPARTIITPGG